MAIRIAVVGLGRLGYEHARNVHYKIPGVELSAVCSVVEAELERASKEMSPKHVTNSFDELLERREFDALVIATSSQVHADQICVAAEAGVKAIYTEKPIGMNMVDLERIKQSIQGQRGIVFQVGYNHRFDVGLMDAQRRVQAGEIGKLIMIRLAGRDQKGMEEFLVKFSPTSGGIVFDMMTHDYDAARWITGADAKRIFGLGGVYEYEGLRAVGDLDNAAIMMEFTDGTMVQIEASRTSSFGYHAPAEIYGTNGCIKIGEYAHKNRVAVLSNGGVTRQSAEWFYEYWEPTYRAELIDFVDCIRNARAPRVGLEDGFKAVEWALTAADAVRNRQVIGFRSVFDE